jgi:hypothetical protein
MKAIDIMHIFSSLSGVTGLDTVKKWLCVLIVIAGIGTLGPISLPQEVQQKSWLLTSSPLIFHPYLLDNLVQEKGIILDEDHFTLDGDDCAIQRSQIFLELSPIANVKLLTSPLINLHWVTFFDTIKSSPYVSFFASLPLRSPPYIFLI